MSNLCVAIELRKINHPMNCSFLPRAYSGTIFLAVWLLRTCIWFLNSSWSQKGLCRFCLPVPFLFHNEREQNGAMAPVLYFHPTPNGKKTIQNHISWFESNLSSRLRGSLPTSPPSSSTRATPSSTSPTPSCSVPITWTRTTSTSCSPGTRSSPPRTARTMPGSTTSSGTQTKPTMTAGSAWQPPVESYRPRSRVSWRHEYMSVLWFAIFPSMELDSLFIYFVVFFFVAVFFRGK